MVLCRRAGLGVPNPTTTVDTCHKASLVSSEKLVELLLTGDPIYYVEHRECMLNGSADGGKPSGAGGGGDCCG